MSKTISLDKLNIMYALEIINIERANIKIALVDIMSKKRVLSNLKKIAIALRYIEYAQKQIERSY